MDNNHQIAAIRARLTEPIVLIGMMGAGKTTQGRKIAKILDLPFIDSDIEIEISEKRSVKDIFEQNGEAHFRDLEKRKIAELLTKGRMVLSVGGGAVTNPETLNALIADSLCCWFDVPVDILAKRVAGTGTRPLLNGGQAVDILNERMEQRHSLYNQAHIRVNGAGDAETVAMNALAQIYDYLLKDKQ